MQTADEFVALGDRHSASGQADAAEAAYARAHALLPGHHGAHVGQARLRLPGPPYTDWLGWLHEGLRPASYLEIGVAQGDTLTLARRGSLAIGVDPVPRVAARPASTETCLFPQPSDDFFAGRALDRLLGGQPLALAFVDGLHEWRQALRDVLNCEAYCGPGSLIAIHDTLPVDELSQRPVCASSFWTGDVWKTALFLRRYRPDLEVFTIPTFPSGLTVVLGFGQPTRQARPIEPAALATLEALSYAEAAEGLDDELGVLPNDRALVGERLRRAGLPLAAGG